MKEFCYGLLNSPSVQIGVPRDEEAVELRTFLFLWIKDEDISTLGILKQRQLHARYYYMADNKCRQQENDTGIANLGEV